MKVKVTVPATVEPVTLEEARKHLRIEPFGSPLEHPDDSQIEISITTAREFLEEYLERSLTTKTYELALDAFPSYIELPYDPIQSVTEITYTDKDGAEQTLSPTIYYFDEYDGRIYPRNGENFPQTLDERNVVKVTFVAGYTFNTSPDTHPIPFALKSAMLLIIGNLYENRQQDMMGTARLSFNTLPMGVYNLVQPYRQNIGA